MHLAVSLPVTGVSLADTPAFTRQCEDQGFSAAWASEVAGPDFPSLLGAVAVSTDLALGVAVTPALTRTAWLIAATASTLSHMSGGRFTLGLGTSSEVIIEQWSGIPFERPLEQLRETVETVRAILGGEKVSGYRLFAEPPAPVPIVVGALNKRSLRQAGEIGDGVCLNQLAPEHVPRVLGEVGREPGDDFPVIARLFCLATDDVAGAREHVRRTFVPYVATSVYNRFYRWLGFEEEAEAVKVAMSERDREAATKAISDRLLDAVTVIGDDDAVAARVQEYADAGVTVPVIACVGDSREDSERTMRAVAALAR